MKVILLKDVANLGRKFDVVVVSDGYALNKLIPKNQALPASEKNINQLTAKRNKLSEIQGVKQEEFKSAIAKLNDQVIQIKTKVNDQGHLFETLKVSQVVEALNKLAVGLNIDEVSLLESIKEAGKHEITLVSGKIEAKLNIEIITE